MNFEETKNFKIESASLKEVRVFAREVFKKNSIFEQHTDDLVLALAEAAQNIVKHGYNNQPTEDEMKIVIKFDYNFHFIFSGFIIVTMFNYILCSFSQR